MDFSKIIVTFFGFMVALTMHEAAHAYAARFFGDQSPETRHRATINPVPHIDLWGTILFPLMMLLSGTRFMFGWAKPTQVDARYFKRPKRDIVLVALAGPGMNFLLAVLCGLLIRYHLLDGVEQKLQSLVISYLLEATIVANLVIGIFNLVPFPGSDGWRVLTNYMKYDKVQALEKYSFQISIGVMMLFIFGAFEPLFRAVFGLFSIFLTSLPT